MGELERESGDENDRNLVRIFGNRLFFIRLITSDREVYYLVCNKVEEWEYVISYIIT